MTQEKVVELARKFVAMVDENEVGLSTWHMACEELYQQLRRSILENKEGM